jgi:enoyl-CoA hydratase/carnithine racemase
VTGANHEREDDVTTRPTGPDRWKALDFGPPPSGEAEPDQPVLVEYVSDGRIAVITLNRPQADNAITTEMGARLTEILETIAVRPAVRVAIITGAGERAFSVGSDLRQRKDMTKEEWLRQRQDFDRTLYTLRQLRKPIFAAVNGIAYGGGSEVAQSTDFIIASENATFGQPEAMIGLAAGGGSPALLPRVCRRGKLCRC